MALTALEEELAFPTAAAATLQNISDPMGAMT
jgi:hypothetical protein